MTTIYWQGDAAAVAQVQQVHIENTWATDDIATITINGKAITFTVGATQTVAAVVAGLVAAWNASTNPECQEVTATDANPYVTLTADTAGVPFTVTASETTAGDGTATLEAVTTASAGPNDWSTAGNWSSGTVPTNLDDVVFENSDVSVFYGLDQHTVTLTSLTARASYTGYIGLPRWNDNGYYEYRPQYLQIGATTATVGQGEGNGSGRLKLDAYDIQTAVNLYKTAAGAETGIPAMLWKGTHGSNAVNAVKGELGIAFFAGETATVATAKVGYVSNQASDVWLEAGSGTTLTTYQQDGGDVVLRCVATTITKTAGTLQIDGAAAVTTIYNDGGTVKYNSSGTLTTYSGAGDLDFAGDLRAKTVSNCDLSEGASLSDPYKVVTFTNGVDLNRCGVADVTLNLGENLRLTRGAVA